MDSGVSRKTGYVIAGLLGAASGGLVVLIMTNAIPRMMKQIMAGMMENMRAQMSSVGCKPEDM